MKRAGVFTSCAAPLAALALGWVPGCKGQPAGSTADAGDVPLKPGTEYMDEVRQAQYEAAWHRYFSLFEPPQVGDCMVVKKKDGVRVGGVVQHLSPKEVVLVEGEENHVLSREDIDPSSQPDLFPDSFARREALREVEEIRLSGLRGRVVAPPMSLRYIIADNVIPRSGPGPRYRRIRDQGLPKGLLLEVLQQRELWIRARAIDSKEEFWIPLLLTRPAPNEPHENYEALVDQMRVDEIISSYRPENGVVYIPRPIWVGMDPPLREGLARMLAAHSAIVRKASTDWIEIRDADTGRRIARYSHIQGFRMM